MNKFDAINKVMVSTLSPEDKCLLVELIMRADIDNDWECKPSVERLCKVRGIKYEKNFKGADHYLPGLVTKIKRGRKNHYYINTPALEGLSVADVIIKHTDTPAVEGVNTPAVADNTPAVEGANTPAVEGANSTEDNTIDNTRDSTESPSPSGPVDDDSLNSDIKEEEMNNLLRLNHGARKDLVNLAGVYHASDDQVQEAALLLTTKRVPGGSFKEQCSNALTKVGVEMERDEW